ncbi:hypothetical protein N7466_006216 [Penicillium verhagenii]|uniref:uncharacterized protein n=1 Tax=Penicillium verhagenii TaxID=1562060 RepID=UPI0025457F7C|nr:uncharacterized protein N7466_006216 [Penicillium verhagenii]KAJ5930723.1 hypothetical protein N7466_006216 [Penicillium verhagenii]
MSTRAPATTPIVTQGPPSVRIPSYESGAFHTPEDLSPLDADLESSDFLMAEDARGVDPPTTVDDSTTHSENHDPQETPAIATYTTETGTEAPENETTTATSELEDISVLPPLADCDDSSLLPLSENGDHERGNNQTLIEEREMRQKLMDMESSFLPEPSTIDIAATGTRAGADDTYLVGIDGGGYDPDMTQQTESSQFSFIPPWDKNPDYGHYQEEFDETKDNEEAEPTTATHGEYLVGNESTLDSLTSSPSAAAMFRNLRRNQSTLSDDTADHSRIFSPEERPFRSRISQADESQLTPSKLRRSSRSLSPTQSRLFSDQSFSAGGSRRSGSRPKYLTSRQSANRLSHSSVASNNTTNTDATNSDATLGADYALQSGGAASDNWGGLHPGSRGHMTRTTSLGSMASGVSGYSEENSLERRPIAGQIDGGLQTLQEESSPQSPRHQAGFDDASAPATPKAKPQDRPFPTDTAIAERVKGIQVPTTFAQRFREDYGNMGPSPEKRAGTSTPALGRSGLGRNMTLKEQSSTIDRLSKENFDLKMRIHFLNEALNKRSEEGIKEMISENVELKSDKLKIQKESQGLKRKIRELEKQLKDQQSDKESMLNHDPEASDEGGDRESANETEISYLRERMETYELEVERLRSESIGRESEKRRLAEIVKALTENRTGASETGAREERDMWKDMLDAEAAAREQAEEENRRLRDESIRLRSELFTSQGGGSKLPSRDRGYSTVSYNSASERDGNRATAAAMSTSNNTLMVELELLKQENAELRKEVSAQTSMLTSRNREKERLYQEIEELKLGHVRHAGRSVAGDSIFDRSVSRAQGRPGSEPSDGGVSRSDMDREELDARNGQLRDHVSTLKLENQALRGQLDEYVRELEALDKAYQADVDQAEEEMSNLQQERDQSLQERDQALQMADERDAAFQDLRAEAQEELDALGEELDQKIIECQRMGEDLRNQDESLRVLQAEMRSASEGIIRLEEDAQNNLERYKTVQHELEETHGEMDSMEKNLFEANTKVQRLTVQIESSQNEIAFLREEQDGDKIRIGDLESELKTYHMSLVSEKEKTRELEQRLADERHQREVVGSKEKQEVQRIMNELNREASAAKEEVRRLKKSLLTQEIETSTWRERLMDLENNLRETLGDLNGSRSSMISNIMKLQKELESTALDLESVRSQLDEKESLLRNRDALLESHGLESRKLSEVLERERQARRADKQSFEQALKSHQQASRTITQSNSRITELENARNQDRKRFTSLEQQFKDQLNERNTMFLAIWKRLSSICGPDWAHSNSLINGNLPSQEVIGNILFWPGFSRNLLLAIKTVEGVVSQFKGRIRAVEFDLNKQYQHLEHSFAQRVRRLDRVEEAVKNMRAGGNQSHSSSSSELSKLRGENRLLKAEINLLQSNTRGHGAASSAAAAVMASGPRSPSLGSTADAERQLTRHSSTSGNSENPRSERSLARSVSGLPQPTHSTSGTTLVNANSSGAILSRTRSGQQNNWEGGDDKWKHRLHELEKRLKAEREGRLLDRNGARKRLEERDNENQKLRDQLQRERTRKPSGAIEAGRNRAPVSDENPSSSEGEGIILDIEV